MDKKAKITKFFWQSMDEELNLRTFIDHEVKKFGRGFYFKNNKFVHHSDLNYKEMAFRRLSKNQKVIITALFIIIFISFALNWHLTLLIFIASLSLLYLFDLLFNFLLITRSFTNAPEIKISKKEIEKIKENDWPIYTVLCPLYKEWQVIPQFISAISDLDYPKDKLQVMLLLEEDDKESIAKIQEYKLPAYFEVIVVPHSLPKTKPKACNYGLRFAIGEYCVIYDAEDIPDPLQLKMAILAFKKCSKNTKCIQAKLNFYNPHQNLLTRIFTSEYSLWFDLVLPGLQSINAPIPLGGTSNHFLTQNLKDLKGWDSFNVTEDCDLGIRLAKKGYLTAIVDSTTYEEANSKMGNWFWQRTRWIKGYIQTYFVHMRRPGEFFDNVLNTRLITFNLVVGGKITSMFINPVMWILTISYFILRGQIGNFIESFYPTPILYIGVISLSLGNFLYVYFYLIGCVKRKHYTLVKYFVLVPFYWLAMSAAAWVALYKIIIQPHYWFKTKHGLHLNQITPVSFDQISKEMTKVNIN